MEGGEMTAFKVVSIDMFRTLADVEPMLDERWRKLLKGKYTPELAQECQNRMNTSWNNHFPTDKFVLQKQLCLLDFQDLFSIVPCEFSPAEATQLTVEQHAKSQPFDDAMLFLNQVGQHYPICLATDADEDILGTLRNMYAFDYVFTSEQLRTYKGDANGRFFSIIVDHYAAEPQQIIHIGDSTDEIISAGRIGITTCWLNRKGKIWSDSVRPDYTANSLIEVARILGLIVPERV